MNAPEAPVMLCPRCRTPIRRVIWMFWSACECRVWHTDEQQARNEN